MRTDIVFTLSGPDRVGIVEMVTKAMLDLGGNVQTSRMARLGGEFAILMLVSIPADQLDNLDRALQPLTTQGYQLTVRKAQEALVGIHAGWLAYQIEVHGADHEGIIHDIAQRLSKCGINIESMETSTGQAPHSGTPLFSMSALIAVPPDLANADWQTELHEAGHQANVDITISAQ